MPVQENGAISLTDIQTEFGGSNPIRLNEYYGSSGFLPSSDTISFSDFYGLSVLPDPFGGGELKSYLSFDDSDLHDPGGFTHSIVGSSSWIAGKDGIGIELGANSYIAYDAGVANLLNGVPYTIIINNRRAVSDPNSVLLTCYKADGTLQLELRINHIRMYNSAGTELVNDDLYSWDSDIWRRYVLIVKDSRVEVIVAGVTSYGVNVSGLLDTDIADIRIGSNYANTSTSEKIDSVSIFNFNLSTISISNLPANGF